MYYWNRYRSNYWRFRGRYSRYGSGGTSYWEARREGYGIAREIGVGYYEGYQMARFGMDRDDVQGVQGRRRFRFGSSGNDFVTATNGYARSGAGDDVIFSRYSYRTNIGAGTGDDTIFSQGGRGRIAGGEGNDTVNFGGNGVTGSWWQQRYSGMTITLNGNGNGRAYGRVGGRYTFLGLQSVENVVGTVGNDRIFARGDQDNVLDGGAGNDYINAGGGDDTLIGGAGYNTLVGGAGNDTVDYSDAPTRSRGWWGRSGVTVRLGEGWWGGYGSVAGYSRDRLFSIENVIGSQGDDRIYGNSQDNELSGLAGNDYIVGGRGSDVIDGGAGHDVLYGDTNSRYWWWNRHGGDDVLDGGLGRDRLYGGGGDDTLRGGAGNDLLFGGVGSDTADYSDVTREGVVVNLNSGMARGRRYWWDHSGRVEGTAGFDRLYSIENVRGSDQADHIYGNNFNNVLEGEGGNDFISAGGGNDTLDGGAGNDRLIGGSGSDTYRFSDGDGHDTVTDSSGAADTLSFDDSVMNVALTFDGSNYTLTYGGTDAMGSSVQFGQNSIEQIEVGGETVSFEALANLLDEAGEQVDLTVTDEGVFVEDNSAKLGLDEFNDGVTGKS
ncbi:MAG: calcium-binding protein [Pseudomonadota bacterium]